MSLLRGCNICYSTGSPAQVCIIRTLPLSKRGLMCAHECEINRKQAQHGVDDFFIMASRAVVLPTLHFQVWFSHFFVVNYTLL